MLPGRPPRLEQHLYRQPGRVFHCRLGLLDRRPALADARVADIVVEALRYYHGGVVRVLAFCVMPDHLHLLVQITGARPLPQFISDFKRWTTRQARAAGAVLDWQPAFFEHAARSDEDLRVMAQYILANPVRAGLVASESEHPWAGSMEWDL